MPENIVQVHTQHSNVAVSQQTYFCYLSNKYSQTCIKRSPLGQRKSGFLRQVTS